MSFPRYPEYKGGNSWLEQVPVHWSIKPLKYIASCNDDVLPESTPPDFELTYVDISGVDGINGIISRQSLPFSHAPSRARRLVRDGDVIISTVRTYLRAFARIIDPEENLVVSTGFAVIRPASDVVPRFLGYALQANYFIEQVIARSTGVSYPAINASELIRIPVALPPEREQAKISDFLDIQTAKLDALTAEQQRLIEFLKEKRQAVVSLAVTKGLNPDAPMKPSGAEWCREVPAHWKMSPLKFFARVGNGSTPSRDKPSYWAESGFPWVNSSSVNQDSVSVADRYVTEEALRECHLPRLSPPTVLVGLTGQGRTRGMASTLLISATISQHLAYIQADPMVASAQWVRLVVDANYAFMRSESEENGATRGAITCKQLSSMRFPLPPLSEQVEIADAVDAYLTQIDKLSFEVQRSIDLLQERRTAMISTAVTGQIDVRCLAERVAAA